MRCRSRARWPRCARRTLDGLAAAACHEADFNYPVPRRMTQADCEALLRQVLPTRRPGASRRALSAGRGFQQGHHLRVATGARQFQRRAPAAVGQGDAGAGVEQRAQRRLVARAAVAQHDGLDHRRPVQVVDVVQRRPGADELAHDAVVPQVRRGDQRRAVVAAGHQLARSRPAPAARAAFPRRRRRRRWSPRRSGRSPARRGRRRHAPAGAAPRAGARRRPRARRCGPGRRAASGRRRRPAGGPAPPGRRGAPPPAGRRSAPPARRVGGTCAPAGWPTASGGDGQRQRPGRRRPRSRLALPRAEGVQRAVLTSAGP